MKTIQVPRRTIDGPFPVVDWEGPEVPYRPQHLDEWCWAACAEMVMARYDPTEQCQIARDVLNGLPCCDDVGTGCEGARPTGRANPAQCNCSVSADKIDGLWRRLLGPAPQREPWPVRKQRLISELTVARRPVAPWCRLCEEQTFHVVLVVAYSPSLDRFKVHDPCFEKGAMTYEEIVRCQGIWVWQQTWVNLGR